MRLIYIHYQDKSYKFKRVLWTAHIENPLFMIMIALCYGKFRPPQREYRHCLAISEGKVSVMMNAEMAVLRGVAFEHYLNRKQYLALS